MNTAPRKISLHHRESGLSTIGALLTLIVLAALAFALIRCLPVWTEYAAVKRNLQLTANEFSSDARPTAVRAAFDKRAEMDGLPVNGKAIEISNGVAGRAALSVKYARQVPLVANVSLLFDLNANAMGVRVD